MNGHQLIYVFFFFAVAITAASETGEVAFWDTTVTLTCPYRNDENVKWYKEDKEFKTGNTLSISDYTDKNEGLYHCSVTDDKSKTHYFYIKAKVCKGCVELDMLLAFAVVFADVLITLGIVIMVYVCAKKKSGTAAPQRAAQPRQQRGQQRGPPIPDPDYQPLNPATRANDVYSQANRRHQP